MVGEYSSLPAGAIRLTDNGTVNMFNGKICNNTYKVPDTGGAVFLDGSNTTFNMYDGEISNNEGYKYENSTYYAYSGAICAMGYYENNLTINISGGKIANNIGYYGGAITSVMADVTIKNTVIEYNESACGGAILAFGGSCLSENNKFMYNSAVQDGGAIYSYYAEFESKNDQITENTADNGGGVCIDEGSIADLSTSKVYNNKATSSANDYYISEEANSIKIMDASQFNKIADINDKTIPINGWYKDFSNDRYSSSNYTDKVNASSVVAGTTYNLIAATDECEISYDDDGKTSSENATRRLQKNSKIKINANGGTYSTDEIELTSDVVIENPTKDNLIFAGWSEENVEGYALGLKAKWRDKEKYTVTFKVVNGTWFDGTTANKTLEIEENSEQNVVLKTSDIPTGMKANTNYKNGSWDKTVTEDIILEGDVSYTYTFVKDETNNNESNNNNTNTNSNVNTNTNTNTNPNMNTNTNTNTNSNMNTNTNTNTNTNPNTNIINTNTQSEKTNSTVTDSVTEDTKNDTEKSTINPNTNDNISTYCVAFVISIFCLLSKKNQIKRRPKHYAKHYQKHHSKH